jgi:hypothetical protein
MAAADEEDAGKRQRTHACERQHGAGTDTTAWGRAAWAVGGGDDRSMGRGMGPQHGAGPLHGQRRWPWVRLRRRTCVRTRGLQGRLPATGHRQRYGPMFWGNRGGGAGRGCGGEHAMLAIGGGGGGHVGDDWSQICRGGGKDAL